MFCSRTAPVLIANSTVYWKDLGLEDLSSPSYIKLIKFMNLNVNFLHSYFPEK